MVESFVTGRDLRAMRQKSGKTISQIVKACQLKSRKTYHNWENNVGGPNVNQWLIIVRLHGFDAADFIDNVVARNCREEDIDLDNMTDFFPVASAC